MIEPCKEAKCISYPICMNKPLMDIYKCETFSKYLKVTFNRRVLITYEQDDERIDLIWSHMKNIFPKLKRMNI